MQIDCYIIVEIISKKEEVSAGPLCFPSPQRVTVLDIFLSNRNIFHHQRPSSRRPANQNQPNGASKDGGLSSVSPVETTICGGHCTTKVLWVVLARILPEKSEKRIYSLNHCLCFM